MEEKQREKNEHLDDQIQDQEIDLRQKHCPHCHKSLPDKMIVVGISPICPYCDKPVNGVKHSDRMEHE